MFDKRNYPSYACPQAFAGAPGTLPWLNARSAGYAGDPAQAATEADHLHNLPELLQHLAREELHAFYWEATRTSYLGESKAEYAQQFETLWAELDAANRAAGIATGQPA